MVNNFKKSSIVFFKSSNFQKGLILAVAIIIPVVLLNFSGHPELSFSIGIGALLNSPSDIPGSLKRRVNSILISTVLTMLVTLLVILLKPYLALLLPFLAVAVFSIALIATFGFRGALISFSGLLALVLGLIDRDYTISEILKHVGLIGIGGLWYLVVSLIFYKISPKKDEDELLKDTLDLTGDYILLRAELLTENKSRTKLHQEALKLQSQINEKHETLRELLLNVRKRSGRSHYDEKRLLIFISMVDILELALANSWDYKKLDVMFANHPQAEKSFKNLNILIGNHLKQLGDTLISKEKLPNKKELIIALEQASKALTEFIKNANTAKEKDRAILLKNLYDYQEKQIYELRSIRRSLANVKNASRLSLHRKDADQYITHQEYRFSILLESLSFKSPIFRHALRLTVAILFAYLFGTVIGIKNPYWIVLTLIVIMRPNYGLTKERSFNRVIGTVVGALVASAIILLTQNVVVYAFLATVSLIFAFALVQQSYKIAAGFITLNVVFVFALLEPNAFDIIQFRVLDTLIGAVIALLLNYMLWPSWESMNLQGFLYEVIQKNQKYLVAIHKLYHDKNIIQSTYRIPRKEAFLATANLNSAFQRMTQDPKSKQREYELIYEMVALNNTILSAIASLSSFIQNHDTFQETKQFDIMVKHIISLLNDSTVILDEKIPENIITKDEVNKAEVKLLDSYEDLLAEANIKEQQGKIGMVQELLPQIQEAHLLYNQLVWLKNLSEDLKKTCLKYRVAF